jgi:hypothetical protein
MSVVLDYMRMLHTQITPEVAVTTDCSKNQHVSLSSAESNSLIRQQAPNGIQDADARIQSSRSALQCQHSQHHV